MKISAQEEYGLRCLLQLAYLKEGESLTLAQMAEREGISVANAGKLPAVRQAAVPHALRVSISAGDDQPLRQAT